MSASRSGTQGRRFEVSLPCRMRMIKNIDHSSYSIVHPHHHGYHNVYLCLKLYFCASYIEEQITRAWEAG